MFKRDRDIELISAYIDDELSPGERQALEARLARDADLRRDLEEMRANVRLLRKLPQVKAPRNFTLDPAAAGKRKARRVARGFDWWGLRASAVMGAASSLVLVLGVLLIVTAAGGPEASRGDIAAAPTVTAPPAALGAMLNEAAPATGDDGAQAEEARDDADKAAEPTQLETFGAEVDVVGGAPVPAPALTLTSPAAEGQIAGRAEAEEPAGAAQAPGGEASLLTETPPGTAWRDDGDYDIPPHEMMYAAPEGAPPMPPAESPIDDEIAEESASALAAVLSPSPFPSPSSEAMAAAPATVSPTAAPTATAISTPTALLQVEREALVPTEALTETETLMEAPTERGWLGEPESDVGMSGTDAGRALIVVGVAFLILAAGLWMSALWWRRR